MIQTRPKLCVLTTHTIQYMAPWFRAFTETSTVELEVIFLRELDPVQQGVGFGAAFQWDLPLREGYRSRVLGIAAGFMHMRRLICRLQAALCASRPDVVLITGWNEPGLAAAYPLLRSLAIPVLLRGESNDLRPRSGLQRFLHRSLLRLVAAIAVIGQSNRRFYLRNGVTEDRLFSGAYFLETDRMLGMAAEHQGERAGLRRHCGFDDEDFVFSFVGKHVPFKRPMMLVEAAAQVRERGWPVKVLFAGSGELTEALKQRASELGVPAHFTGFLNQTEMWRAYVPADAFVLPSTNGETWGLVTNEAMLFGLPVIVSDQVGCGPDLVVEGETGFIFHDGVGGLAAAMERLLQARHRAPAIGLAGRRRVVEHYSMPVATEGLLAAVRFVLGRHGGRDARR